MVFILSIFDTCVGQPQASLSPRPCARHLMPRTKTRVGTFLWCRPGNADLCSCACRCGAMRKKEFADPETALKACSCSRVHEWIATGLAGLRTRSPGGCSLVFSSWDVSRALRAEKAAWRFRLKCTLQLRTRRGFGDGRAWVSGSAESCLHRLSRQSLRD